MSLTLIDRTGHRALIAGVSQVSDIMWEKELQTTGRQVFMNGRDAAMFASVYIELTVTTLHLPRDGINHNAVRAAAHGYENVGYPINIQDSGQDLQHPMPYEDVRAATSVFDNNPPRFKDSGITAPL